jgi:hypothetical protein
MNPEKQVSLFNSDYKVGDLIRYREDGIERSAPLRWPAELSENGTPICWLKGKQEATKLNDVL